MYFLDFRAFVKPFEGGGRDEEENVRSLKLRKFYDFFRRYEFYPELIRLTQGPFLRINNAKPRTVYKIYAVVVVHFCEAKFPEMEQIQAPFKKTTVTFFRVCSCH